MNLIYTKDPARPYQITLDGSLVAEVRRNRRKGRPPQYTLLDASGNRIMTAHRMREIRDHAALLWESGVP